MFDVFYSGKKPGRLTHERKAETIEHAQALSRTRYFWWVHYLADLDDWDFLWEPVPWESQQRHAWCSQWQPDAGVYLVPRAGYTDTNYHTDRMITRTADRSKWNIPSNIDTDHFDFSWHPNPADPAYTYQFGTQHQRTGGPVYPVPEADGIKFVDQIRATTSRVATAIYEIDHMCGNAGQIVNTTKTMRYFDNYRDTLIRIARSIGTQHEFVWICSSICDYANFDFSWHPEQWQATMLHVFASNDQKFGDTFFMHVPTFAARAEQHKLLEWSDVNFINTAVPRRPMPVIVHDGDSQVDTVKNTDWAGPLATFTNHDYVPSNMVTVPLWRNEVKAIVPVSSGAGTVVVPRCAVPYIKTQLYDYPYIDKTKRILSDTALDIVFISNGENEADHNFDYLKWVVEPKSPNRVHRVDGVNGRVAAYHEAARHSRTPWFFAVFAKLQISDRFDWSWQPDRMQQAKHYIFHAHNPINGLVYGHQAMIAYNKRLVLENQGKGLDFTLDQAHEVVPIISGTANYHTDDWMCWRTAFREVLKLRASLPDVENEYRLNQWLTVDRSEHQWSAKGAADAIEYYDAVRGEFDELKKSYEWQWLATYAFMKRNLTASR